MLTLRPKTLDSLGVGWHAILFLLQLWIFSRRSCPCVCRLDFGPLNEMELIPDTACVTSKRKMRYRVAQKPRAKPNTTDINNKKKSSDQMTLMIFCYIPRSVCSFLPVAGGNNYRDHGQTSHTEKDIGTHSSKCDASVSSLSSELRESLGKGGEKSVRARGNRGD